MEIESLVSDPFYICDNSIRQISAIENEFLASYSSQNTGLVDDQVREIHEKIEFMTNKIQVLSEDLSNRFNSLNSLVDVVQSGRKANTTERPNRQTRSLTRGSLALSSPPPVEIKKKERPLRTFNRVLSEE